MFQGETIVSAGIVIGDEDITFGFSFHNQYESDPLEITSTRSLFDPRQLFPTCILFTKDKVFHSIGYPAKEKYLELLNDNEHEDWYFFERFLSLLTLQNVRNYIIKCEIPNFQI